MFLKQSTSVVISFGPFLDKTDGVTLETGLVSALDHASTGILLSKNGGTLTIRHATVTATTYDAHGCYKVTLDTTDTGTVGSVRAIYTDSATCLPVWMDFQVLPANVYDSVVGGSDLLDVSMTQILGAAVSTPATAGILDVNVKNIDNDAASASGTVTFPNATLASTTNITAGTITTVTTATNVTTVNGLAAGVITATSIAADAITDAKVASDVTIASVTGNVGSVTGLTVTDVGAIKAKTDNLPTDPADQSLIIAATNTILADTNAILIDTNELQTDWVNGGRLDLILDARSSQTSVDDLPTNAELATSQATADDATLAAIAALNNLDAAGIRAAMGLASANLDTQITVLRNTIIVRP